MDKHEAFSEYFEYGLWFDPELMEEEENEYLEHYGMPRRSGRYPWGSGEHPYQDYGGFLGQVHDFRQAGLSEPEVAKAVGCIDKDGSGNVSILRARMSYAKNEKRKMDYSAAIKMKNKGMSNTAIAKRLGMSSESSVRSLLNKNSKDNTDRLETTMNALTDEVNRKGMIDIGRQSERMLGVTRTTMDRAVINLEDQGYGVIRPRVKQLGTGNTTSLRVLVSPETYGKTETEHKAALRNAYNNLDKIQTIDDIKIKEDATGTQHLAKFHNPVSVDSNRVKIRYAEDGGKEKDGNIELNPNAKDLSLGKARYAQVRILVDNGYYVKGVATYGDPKDFPKGCDIIFNTNKDKSHPKTGEDGVLKKIKDVSDDETKANDPFAIFGATVTDQNDWYDEKGKRHEGALNIVNEEGVWATWSKNLPSQFLSKQPQALAKKQLAKAYDEKQAEYDEISSLTNPVIKKTLLDQFASSCDSASVHMKAAAMPRQQTHVIIPIPSMKPTEVYAPNYSTGEKVCLVRFPHAGRFEIPELTVNNNNRAAKKVLGNAKDAIGINALTAEQLSGADFDGDTVLVIPNDGSIKTEKAIKGLATFDTQAAYPGGVKNGFKIVGQYSPKTAAPGETKSDYDGFKKGLQMGMASNLITDMTIAGAKPEEIVRATKYSMVVIDAEKHQLNWKQAEKDFGIKELQKKYQNGGGASTIISRSTSPEHPLERKQGEYRIDPVTGKKKKYYIDPDTGEKLYTYTGSSYTDKNGKIVMRKTNSKKMLEVKDAYELNPNPTPIERIYADHANKMKALANKARKDTYTVGDYKKDPEMSKKYANEVDSLNAKLNRAEKNEPLERRAQAMGNAYLKRWKEANPDADYDEIKKYSGRYLRLAREQVGSGKERINITDKEWEAIQNRAISKDRLERIVANSDLDRLKDLATPKERTKMTDSKVSRAKALLAAGTTTAEVAEILGVSASTINRYCR